jgi:FkbM family methyltransferase
MNTSIFTYLRRFYSFARHWRYRGHPDVADRLDLADFIDYSTEFIGKSGLRPLLLTEQGVFVRTAAGFFLWFDPRFKHGNLWGIEKSGVWEPAAIKICLDKMRPGGTFLDVGANVGVFSLSVACATTDASVHAFEPVPDNFRVLERNVKVNCLDHRIVLNRLAVGDQCKSMSIAVNGQLSHITQGKDNQPLPTVTVNAVTLDQYCATNHITDVRLLKCDVEGFELKVLHGAKEVLEDHKPAIMVEICKEWTNRYSYSPEDIFSYLRDFGYSGNPLSGDGERSGKGSPFSDQADMYLFEFER